MGEFHSFYKKLLTLLFFIVVCSVCLFAKDIKDIVVYGFGDTVDSAKNNARVNLASYINGELVTSFTGVVTSDSGKGAVNESFNQSISVSTEGELIGVEYSNPVKTSGSESAMGTYKVSATIYESKLPMYLAELRTIVKSIDTIYGQSFTSVDAQKIKLINLIISIQKYENYRQVVSFLGAKIEDIPIYEAPVTYQSVSTEYQSILEEEKSKIMQDMQNQKDDTIALAELYSKLDLLQKEQKAFEEQQKEANRIAEQASLMRVQEQLNSFLKNESILTGNTVFSKDWTAAKEIMGRVSLAQKEWLDIFGDYNDLVNQESSRLLKELNSQKKALEEKAYKLTEMSNKKPTKEAIANREKEIDELVNAKKNEFVKIEKLIQQSMLPILKARYDAFLTEVNNLNEKTFIVDLNDEPLKFINRGFDANKKSWKCVVGFLLDDRVLTIGSWDINYEELGGMVPEEMNYISGTYDSEVEVFNELLGSQMGKYFNVSAAIKVRYDLKESKFEVSIVSLELTKKGVVIKSLIDNPVTIGSLSNNLSPVSKPDWIDTNIVLFDEKDQEKKAKKNSSMKLGNFKFGMEAGLGANYVFDSRQMIPSASIKVPILYSSKIGVSELLEYGVVPTISCGIDMDGHYSLSGGLFGEILYAVPFESLIGILGLDLGFSGKGVYSDILCGIRVEKVDYYVTLKYSNNAIGATVSVRYMF